MSHAKTGTPSFFRKCQKNHYDSELFSTSFFTNYYFIKFVKYFLEMSQILKNNLNGHWSHAFYWIYFNV